MSRPWILSLLFLITFFGNGLAQRPQPIGSDYIPGDATAAVVLNVADSMVSPALSYYPIEVADAWCKQNIGFPASIVDEVKLVVGAPGPGEPLFALVAKLNQDLDPQSLNPQTINVSEPVKVGDHSCYRIAGADDLALHLKDARTLIVSTPNYLDTVLRASDGQSSGPLATLAGGVANQGNLTALVAIEPIRPMVNGTLQMSADKIPPPLVEFTEIPNLLDAIFLRVDMENQQSGMKLVMLAVDEDSAGKLQDLIERGLRMGQQIGLAQAMQQIQGDDEVANASRQYAQRMADTMIAQLTPEREGRKLSISAPASQGVATQGVLVALLLPAVQSARQAARNMSSMNNMKQLGLAMFNYHDVHQGFPGDIKSEDGTPLLSWRVAILPFLEQQALYEQFRLDEPWDSPHNAKLIEFMPEVLKHPMLPVAPGMTVYQRPSGEAFVLHPTRTIGFRDIIDGSSNTIMGLATTPDNAVPWTKPNDLAIDVREPLAGIFISPRGINALMCDGAVRAFSPEIDPEQFAAFLTYSGREPVR